MGGLGRRSGSVLVAAVLAWSSAGSASAAPRTWRKVPSPSVSPHDHANFLNDVACVRSDWCVTVGQAQSVHAPDTQALIEHWDGNAWSMMTPASLDGQNGLHGVTCLADDDCTAVGWGPNGTLVERWNGATWTAMPSPGKAALDDVACASSTQCFAVGKSGDRALLEQWDGTHWTIAPSLVPDTTSELFGVACASTTMCFAVGQRRQGIQRTFTLTEMWNGTSWSIVRSRNVATTNNRAVNTLFGVACPAPDDCTAVGALALGYDQTATPIAERWNGEKWRLVATPAVPASAILAHIDCVGTYCAAVGYSGSGLDGSSTLVEVTRGHAFDIAASASPGAGYNWLAGVACTDVGACQAVGGWGGDVAPPWQKTLVLST